MATECEYGNDTRFAFSPIEFLEFINVFEYFQKRFGDKLNKHFTKDTRESYQILDCIWYLCIKNNVIHHILHWKVGYPTPRIYYPDIRGYSRRVVFRNEEKCDECGHTKSITEYIDFIKARKKQLNDVLEKYPNIGTHDPYWYSFKLEYCGYTLKDLGIEESKLDAVCKQIEENDWLDNIDAFKNWVDTDILEEEKKKHPSYQK